MSTQKIKNNKTTFRFINKTNLNEFNQAVLSCNWSPVLDESDPNISYNLFMDKFNQLYELYFPFKEHKTKSYKPRKPWITTGLVKSIKTKHKLFLVYINHNSTENHNKYKIYRNKLNHLIKISKNKYFTQKLENARSDLKVTWKILKDLMKTTKRKSNYPNAFKYNNNMISDSALIAGQFNDYFTNIGPSLNLKLQDTNIDPMHYLGGNYVHSLFFSPTDVSEVNCLLNEINVNKSTGPDGLHPAVIKSVAQHISPILVHIFNNSMLTGIIPKALKVAQITPIYKADDPMEFINYRPISILPVLSKILEKVVLKRLLDFLNKHDILNSSQFGFRKHHSTTLALIDLIDNISNSLDNKDYTIGVFLDLSKAFDTINHEILLNKLSYYSIRGRQLTWFSNYLSNRQQYVNFNGTSSQRNIIKCGVPQGSILGPILFLLYINDILNSSSFFKFILFADDTNIICSDKSLTTLLHNVNVEMNKVSLWLKANKLTLNTMKTKFMLFVPKNKRVNTDTVKLYIDGSEIEQTKIQKFLGVIINSQLDWKHHINYIQYVLK